MKRISFAIAILSAALVFAGCSKGSNSSTTTTTTTTNTEASTAPSPAAKTAMTNAKGATVYNTNCSTCHGSQGAGVPGAFPPLAGNPVVTGDVKAVIHIIKNGLTGQIQINGQKYNGQMPPWKATLSNDQIASVVSYIRGSWGNTASAVTSAQVAATP